MAGGPFTSKLSPGPAKASRAAAARQAAATRMGGDTEAPEEGEGGRPIKTQMSSVALSHLPLFPTRHSSTMAPARELARGISRDGRSAAYHRRGVWAIKKKNNGKLPVHPKKAAAAAAVEKVRGAGRQVGRWGRRPTRQEERWEEKSAACPAMCLPRCPMLPWQGAANDGAPLSGHPAVGVPARGSAACGALASVRGAASISPQLRRLALPTVVLTRLPAAVGRSVGVGPCPRPPWAHACISGHAGSRRGARGRRTRRVSASGRGEALAIGAPALAQAVAARPHRRPGPPCHPHAGDGRFQLAWDGLVWGLDQGAPSAARWGDRRLETETPSARAGPDRRLGGSADRAGAGPRPAAASARPSALDRRSMTCFCGDTAGRALCAGTASRCRGLLALSCAAAVTRPPLLEPPAPLPPPTHTPPNRSPPPKAWTSS